jgi:hypothetical protein
MDIDVSALNAWFTRTGIERLHEQQLKMSVGTPSIGLISRDEAH